MTTEVEKAFEEMFGEESNHKNATKEFKDGARMYLRARFEREPFGFGGHEEGSKEFWDFFMGTGAAMDYMDSRSIAEAAIDNARRPG